MHNENPLATPSNTTTLQDNVGSESIFGKKVTEGVNVIEPEKNAPPIKALVSVAHRYIESMESNKASDERIEIHMRNQMHSQFKHRFWGSCIAFFCALFALITGRGDSIKDILVIVLTLSGSFIFKDIGTLTFGKSAKSEDKAAN